MSNKSIKNYVIGYDGKVQDAIYSVRAWSSESDGSGGMDKMTLFQARRHLKALVSDDVTKVIFKLVPVEVIKPRKK